MPPPWSNCHDEPQLPPARCQSYAAIPPDCPEGGMGEICRHCNPGAQAATDACTPERQRCGGLGVPAMGNLSDRSPWVCLSWGPHAWDGEHNRDPFFTTEDGIGGGVYRYVILPEFNLNADKCAPNSYCPGSFKGLPWLCRAMVTGEQQFGWRMFCAEITPDNFYEPMPMILERDRRTNGLLFAKFSLLGDPGCFGPTQDVYVFSQWCDDEWGWDCAGDVARALDWLEVDLDVRFSDDQDVYPTRNPYQRTLENAAWWEACRIVDVLDGHDATSGYAHRDKALWPMLERFDDENKTLIQLGLPPYPPVRGRAADSVVADGYYPEYASDPIPITCSAYIAKTEVPAVLTLEYMRIYAQLHPEETYVSAGNKMRVHANVDVALGLRVRLLPEAIDLLADVGLALMVADDVNALYDLRIADPDDPEDEHPAEVLVATGPNGERVPRQLSWRGLRTHRRYARVPHAAGRGFDFEPPGGHDTRPGCMAVHAIHELVVTGQLNDCREYDPATGEATELPQFCVGQIVFGVPSIGEPGALCL